MLDVPTVHIFFLSNLCENPLKINASPNDRVVGRSGGNVNSGKSVPKMSYGDF